jgi:nucleoside-diphosphate-sugar epimerase
MSTSNVSRPGFETSENSVVLVTGSSGFVGARLVEMLLERKAKRVLCFDVAVPSEELMERFREAAGGDESRFVICPNGDLTKKESVESAFASESKIDLVYHIAALVGPFYDTKLYEAVNYRGSMYVLECCKKYSVPRLVFSSSPSTRFDGNNIAGLKENELNYPKKFLQPYAETKAMAEKEVRAACCNDLLTIAVAPHQVYGPHDTLFLPNLLEVMGNGRLRVFGKGKNLISVCHVDNYCHGLMCGADVLQQNSPALGKFYIITDGPEQSFWRMINQAGMEMGFKDLFSKFHLPVLLLMTIAYICNGLGWLLNKKFKLNPFNVKMLTIHRYFNIENSIKDLKYEPIYTFEEGWKSTIQWFKVTWLPKYLKKGKGGIIGICKKNE